MFKFIKFSLLALGIFFSLTPNHAHAASTDNFVVENFTADYYLTRDKRGISHLRVVEDIDIDYQSKDANHGIIRTIPFTNRAGNNLTTASFRNLDITVTRNGVKEPVNIVPILEYEGAFDVRIGDPDAYVNGLQNYQLTYDFEHVITEGTGMQELYWDTNGTDWTTEFQKVTARVHIPDDSLRASLLGQNWCYTGKYGSHEQSNCEIRRIPDGYEFSTTDLNAYENLTFAIGFRNSTFDAALNQPVDFTNLLVLIILIAIWYTFFWFARHPYCKNRAIGPKAKAVPTVPEYLPPKDITAAEAAACYTESWGSKAIVATMLELAVNHKIELIHRQENWFIKIKNLDMNTWQADALRLLRNKDGDLVVDEEFIIETKTESNTTERLFKKFYKAVLTKIKNKHLYKENLSGKNHFDFSIIIVIILFLSIAFVPMFIDANFMIDPNLPWIHSIGGELIHGLVYYGYIIGIFALIFAIVINSPDHQGELMPDGVKLRRYLDGLKMYIRMAESDRIKLSQSVEGTSQSTDGLIRIYEKLLPYAVIFNQERSWYDLLGKYYAQLGNSDIGWLSGVDVTSSSSDLIFTKSLLSLSNSTNRIASRASLAYTLSNSSSSGSGGHSGSSSLSSSGGGGGGHSGGGGGGGGGRGW